MNVSSQRDNQQIIIEHEKTLEIIRFQGFSLCLQRIKEIDHRTIHDIFSSIHPLQPINQKRNPSKMDFLCRIFPFVQVSIYTDNLGTY